MVLFEETHRIEARGGEVPDVEIDAGVFGAAGQRLFPVVRRRKLIRLHAVVIVIADVDLVLLGVLVDARRNVHVRRTP